MASNFGEVERPIPAPRQQSRPIPKPRTKIENVDVIKSISFSSPLQEPTVEEDGVNLRKLIISNNFTSEVYENVETPPPNYPPPQLPNLDVYDFPRALKPPPDRLSIASLPNHNSILTPEIVFQTSVSSPENLNQDLNITPARKCSTTEILNQERKDSTTENHPEMSEAPPIYGQISKHSLQLMNFMEESFNLPLSTIPPTPPATSPPGSNTSSIYEVQYENFTPMIRVSNSEPDDPGNLLSYENFTPRYSKMVPKSSGAKMSTNSVLLHFDPLLENIFVEDKTCTDSLETVFSNSSETKEKVKPVSIPPEIPERSPPKVPEIPKLPTKVPSPDLKVPSPNSKDTEASGSEVNIDVEANACWYPVPEDAPPPPTPTRLDSIPREDLSKVNTVMKGAIPVTYIKPPQTEAPRVSKRASSAVEAFKSFQKLTKNILHKHQSGTVLGQRVFCRPTFGSINSKLYHSGVLIQPGRDRSDWKVTLRNGVLTWCCENKGDHEVQLTELTSLAAFTPPATSSPNSTPLQCLELAWQKQGQASQVKVFAAPSAQNRSDWMFKILDAMCSDCFPYHAMHGYTLAGWLHVKEGVSGEWVACWMLLKERTLFYCAQPGSVLEADLRKARCIVAQPSGGLLENVGCVLVELQGRALYLQGLSQRDTNRWGHNVRVAALDNGPSLEQQQLTKDDVPVLVDKCINFVSQQGSLSEGIYRRSGTVTAVSRLLQDFSKDAWAVQLTRAQYTEHDVASALKRFFKDLPDPLIPLDLTPKLCRVTARRSLNAEEKISKYRRLLKELSPIAFNTTKRLFGHLHFLHRESAKNLMTASNMAAIWGISLMHQKPMELLGEGQTQIAIELITHYPRVYNVSEAEIARELQLLTLFEKYHSSSSVTPKTAQSSGDLKIWISIGKPGSADTVQVAINPQKTAFEVCAELGRGDDHILQEVVLGGALLRPVHPTEKVFDVVVRWGYWDESDRKDNQLVLAPCPVYQEIVPLAKPPLAACSEVKFADTKSKTFKQSVFELSQAKLCYYKDRKFNTRAVEWKVEDIVWYIGHEPKRDPLTSWSITFIPRLNKPKRSRDQPYFGNTMAGSNQEEMLRWCAAMLLAEHPAGH